MQTTHRRTQVTTILLRIIALFTMLAGVAFPSAPALAAGSLRVVPITWDVIGLDSNAPASGPYLFPVGVKVCNDQAAAVNNVSVVFEWKSANPYINLRTGTSDVIVLPSIPSGQCRDAYFEAQVTRDPGAYFTTRRYQITATAADGSTGSSPVPRQLYIEKLISQNRNSVTKVELDGKEIPPGGTMALVVGNTYTIKLYGGTATQGYNQFEAFINLPNTIFEIQSVSTNYSANNSPYVATTNHPQLYADACLWESDPNSPNYRSCIGGDYKSGGSNVVTTYVIKVISGGGTNQTLTTLLYDFSGSSYHYNSDYSTGARIAAIVDPTNVNISKSFSPNPTAVNGISTLTITLSNPNGAAIAGFNFTDPLPNGLKVASPTGASTIGCGSVIFNPSANDTSLSFSNGTVAEGGSCVIKVNVTATSTGTFTNTTNPLYVGTTNTGKTASASLTVNTASGGTGLCGINLAQWTFADYTSGIPAPNSKQPNVTTAEISLGNGLSAAPDNTGSPAAPSMALYGWPKNGPVTLATSPYIQFAIDTSKYNSIQMSFNSTRKANGPTSSELHYSTDLINWTKAADFNLTTGWLSYGPYNFPAASTTGITYFRIYGYGANAQTSGADMNIDQVTFTGCGTPEKATISKTFSAAAVPVNNTAVLTFTLTNPNSLPLNGAAFTDALPAGVEVHTSPSASTTCGGSPTWSPAPGATSLTFGSPSGAILPAGGSCTASVTVKITSAGAHNNISGFLTTTEAGTNISSIATANINGLLPPSISKTFSPESVVAGGRTRLIFIINNPNMDTALTGVQFNDSLPTGMSVASPVVFSTENCGTPTFNPVGGATSFTFSGATIPAGQFCKVQVDVTAPGTVGSFTNTTSTVSSSNAGSGNTGSDTLTTTAPSPSIALLKQVGPSPSGPWTHFLAVAPNAPVYYRFTIENTGDVPLSNLQVVDSQLQGTSADPAGCSWTAPLPVASATVEPIQSCVRGPVTASSGSRPNTAEASGTYLTSTVTDTDTATYATTGLTLTKSAVETAFSSAGEVLHYSYLVKNTGFATLNGPVVISDDKASATCPALSTIGDLDNFFDPGEEITCTGAYTTTAQDVAAKKVTNRATASAGGSTSNESTATVPFNLPNLTVTKTNNTAGSLPKGGSFTWTIEVSNIGPLSASFGSAGQVILSDNLPGAPEDYSDGALTVIPGAVPPSGTIACTLSSATVSCVALTPVSLPPGASFSIQIPVSPLAAGERVNTAVVDPDELINEYDESDNSARDTVEVLAPPQISKQFSPDAIPLNGATTLTFTITNPNTASALTGVEFSDSLPEHMKVASPPEVTLSGCGTPVFEPQAEDTSLTFSGGTIAAGGTCTASVRIVSTATGTRTNTSAAVSSSNAGTGNQAVDDLTTYQATLTVEKSALPQTFSRAGEKITYSYQLTNTGDIELTGINLSDDKAGAVSCPRTSLAVDEQMTCSAEYTITSADMSAGSVSNTVTARSDQAPDAQDSLTIYRATLSVEKTASPLYFGAVDDSISYSYLVTNTGQVPLTGISLSDDLAGTVSCPQTSLDVAEQMTCTASYSISPGDFLNGTVTNTVTASSNEAPDAADSATVRRATLSVTKSADPGYFSQQGDEIIYEYLIQNTGAVTLHNINVIDDKGGAADCPKTSLAAGENMTCSLTYTILPADVASGSVTNQVTVSSTEAPDAVDELTIYLASAEVTKTAAPLYFQAEGDEITYTYVITNNGSEPLTGIVVSDNKAGTVPCPNTSLAAGGSMTCTTTYLITAADVTRKFVTNTVTVTSNELPPISDHATVSLARLRVVKSADPDRYTRTGEEITYSYEVENVGAYPLTGIHLSDDRLGAVSCPKTSLTAGESMTCTKTYTVTAGDFLAGSLTNTVTAKSDQAPDATSTVTLYPATMTVEKSADPAYFTAEGQTITYSYLITNTGGTPLTGISASDDQLGTVTCPKTSLNIGEQMTCSGTYTITSADVTAKSVTNKVTVSSSETPDEEDTLTIYLARLAVNKSASPVYYGKAGDGITYTYQVRNTGQVALTGISLSDDKAGSVTCPKDSLTAGEEMTCEKTYTVSAADVTAGSVSNTVTASSDQAPDATDQETVRLARLSVSKSASPEVYLKAGDGITYTYQVRNTGQVALTGISLSDDKAGSVTCPKGSLTVGEEMTCEKTYAVSAADVTAGSVSNTVTASSDQAPDATAQETVRLAGLTLTKSASPAYFTAAGQTIHYSYKVTNTGSSSLSGLSVTDDRGVAVTCPKTTLAVDESMTCSGTYETSAADVEAGEVTNHATASSTEGASANDSLTIRFGALKVEKSVSAVLIVNPDVIRITYRIAVENLGGADLQDLSIRDDLAEAFDSAVSWSLTGTNSADFNLNAAYNGSSEVELLAPGNALPAGEEGALTLTVEVNTGGKALVFTNTAEVTGMTDDETRVTGTDSVSGPEFADPAVSKSVNIQRAAVGEQVTFTITATNSGTSPALNVVVTDPLPANLDLVSATASGGRAVEVIAPRTVRVEIGSLDPGEVVTITVLARVNAPGQPPVTNQVTLSTDSLTDIRSNNTSSAVLEISQPVIPATGFAPGVITRLPPQTADKQYQTADDLTLEIPDLGVKMPVVGVPLTGGEWDVTWLGRSAGYLEGSAYPTHSGNSVLTGHVSLPDGTPGPFSRLGELRWGQPVLIHAFGKVYHYEVRQVSVAAPQETARLLQHEEKAWLTLVTCKDFNPVANGYLKRVLVRAVLVRVDPAK